MGFFKTSLLLAIMTALFLAVGFLMGGQMGMVMAFIFALVMNSVAYWNSDKILLRMFGAQQVTRQTTNRDLQDYYKSVERLSQRAGLPMPKVYVLDNDQPNAFATGRNPEHAAVAASRGLLENLSRDEIAGVMAHELAHVKHRDTLIMTVTATFAGAIGMLANFGLYFGHSRNNPLGIIGTIMLMILAPMAAMLVQMAVSRSREYEADRLGAEICGQPLFLASALEKLHMASKSVENHTAERNPAVAHLFIVNPLQGKKMDRLFSTHPNMENRIERLRNMSLSGIRNYSNGDRDTISPYPKSKARDTSRYGSKDRYRSEDRGRSNIPNSGPDKADKDEKPGPWG